jgi:hypothetical protein
MNGTPSNPSGLLTAAEREKLTDPETPASTRDDIRERTRERLSATLGDIRTLYPTLRETDIEAVFAPSGDRDLADTRVATQDALALLVLGMLHNDNHIEMRLSDAIRNATLDYGEDVSVELNIRRGPFPTVEHCLQRFDSEGMTPENLALFERLLFQSEVTSKQLSTAAEYLGIEATPDQVETNLANTTFERLPQTAIVNVDVEPDPDIDLDIDSKRDDSPNR